MLSVAHKRSMIVQEWQPNFRLGPLYRTSPLLTDQRKIVPIWFDSEKVIPCPRKREIGGQSSERIEFLGKYRNFVIDTNDITAIERAYAGIRKAWSCPLVIHRFSARYYLYGVSFHPRRAA